MKKGANPAISDSRSSPAFTFVILIILHNYNSPTNITI